MGRHSKTLPCLWLMTDERVSDARLLAAVARLPRGGGGILFRHHATGAKARRALFDRVAAIARRRRLVLLLAGSARQAKAWGADGWHGRDHRGGVRRMLHSAPVHDARELVAARRGGADMIFVSPLFVTRSHPGARVLGRVRFAVLAVHAPMVVMALGGVRAVHRYGLRGIGADGWGAIDGLSG